MSLVPPYIESLRPYEPGRGAEEIRRQYGLASAIKLSSNENPRGPAPLAIAAASRSLVTLNLYPDGGLALRERLGEMYEARVANVVVGSGSESIMANIIRTFLHDDDEVLASAATFPAFSLLAQSRGIKCPTVALSDFHVDLDALASAITEKTKIIYLANPNNPTGTIFSRTEFDRFYKHVPARTLIILDEAYFEYARNNPKYPDSLHYRHDNVITLRTFSKVHGLAGARVGYGFAHDELISNLLKVKLPFEPASPSQAAALGALDDSEYVAESLAINAKSRKLLQAELPRLGFEAVPSEANFVLLPFASPATANFVNEELLRRGIVVRPLASFGLPHCLRVSTGSVEQTERCLDAFSQVAPRPQPSTAG